jgi:hypothetical protein
LLRLHRIAAQKTLLTSATSDATCGELSLVSILRESRRLYEIANSTFNTTSNELSGLVRRWLVGPNAELSVGRGRALNELAAHPLCCERIGASFDPRFFVADPVGAFFVLLFSSADSDHMGLDLVVAEDSSPAVTPLSVDFAMLIELELWLGHLISSL